MSGEEARERQEAVERFLARAEMTMVGVLSLEELRPTTSQVAQTLRIRLADAWGKARDRRRRSDGEDLRAAATLTSFLRQRHTRSSSHASAPDDNEAADLMLFLATLHGLPVVPPISTTRVESCFRLQTMPPQTPDIPSKTLTSISTTLSMLLLPPPHIPTDATSVSEPMSVEGCLRRSNLGISLTSDICFCIY